MVTGYIYLPITIRTKTRNKEQKTLHRRMLTVDFDENLETNNRELLFNLSVYLKIIPSNLFGHIHI